jgi:hypothetical protein
MGRKCFVLMPFANEMRQVFEHAIKPAAETLEYDCFRADNASGPRNIISEIIDNIFKSDAIVADITGNNPNVFFELGVAQTIANKTIMICEKSVDKLPFDFLNYRVIFYERTIEGISTHLRREIELSLSLFESWSNESTNPVQDFRPVKYMIPLSDQADIENSLRQEKIRNRMLQRELHRKEIMNYSILISEIELMHLQQLGGTGPFEFRRVDAFIAELIHLQSLGLIMELGTRNIKKIPREGDLKEHVALSPRGKEYVDLMSNLFEDESFGAPSKAWCFLPGASPGREGDQEDLS